MAVLRAVLLLRLAAVAVVWLALLNLAMPESAAIHVPAYAVVGGNPARIIRDRFHPRQIEALMKTGWWRFAPWQLKGVRFVNVDEAITDLHARLPGLTPYAPARIHIRDLVSA